MNKKIVTIAVVAVAITICISIEIYTQSSVACSNTLNTISRNYDACKKALQNEVSKTLLPLITKANALKKKLQEMTTLLANFDKEKEKLTKSIEELKKQAQAKGCINCPINTTPVENHNNNNNSGGSNTCGKDKDKESSCRLPNICSICSGLIHQASGKSLCEVCGCNCR